MGHLDISHYLIAIFGWFLYNFLLFTRKKDVADKKEIDFNYKIYFRENWDNWVFTILLAPVLVFYLSDILALVGKWMDTKLEHRDIYYLGCGVLTELVYYGFGKLLALTGRKE